MDFGPNFHESFSLLSGLFPENPPKSQPLSLAMPHIHDQPPPSSHNNPPVLFPTDQNLHHHHHFRHYPHHQLDLNGSDPNPIFLKQASYPYSHPFDSANPNEPFKVDALHGGLFFPENNNDHNNCWQDKARANHNDDRKMKKQQMHKGGILKNTIIIKGKWTLEEDRKLVQSVKRFGIINWSQVVKALNGRLGKQCREQWHNSLCPDIRMTFREQNTEKEAHDMLRYAFGHGINALDTAEMYPAPMNQETQGRTDLYIGSWLKSQSRDKIVLATKVSGYTEQLTYLRDNAKVVRVDASNIKESVEKSLKCLGTDYIDLLQIHWPDRHVGSFGFYYDSSKWRPSVPFVEQLQAVQELINEGKVRYIGVSNETSYGVMEFVHAAKVEGLPKIVSIQNSYSLLVRCIFEVDLVEVCHPKNCNIGLLAYSPLGGGSLTGKYIDINSKAAREGRFKLFPGYMERYNKSPAREATMQYLEEAKKHGLTPVELALGFVRDRVFVTSSIIGATSIDHLKEDIDAFTQTERPLPPEVMADIEQCFQEMQRSYN